MNHSKAPWAVSSTTMVVSADGKMVGNCMQLIGIGGLSPDMAEAAANAQLIAAAPNLLEACKLALYAINERLSVDGSETGAFRSEIDAVLALESAIDKTEESI